MLAFESARCYFPEADNLAHLATVDFASLPFMRMNGLLPVLLTEQARYADKIESS